VGIVPDDIARVRAATDLVQIASEHIALKKVGQRWQGLCPFHAEKTPSFSINGQEGLFHCFGCQKSGDVITFVREMDHLDFVDAVERLASRAGIELHYDDASVAPDRSRRKRLLDVMSRAVAWYHDRLLHASDAATARAYLRSRGYDGDIVRRYSIGYAPDDWDALARELKVPDDVLRDSGLGFVNRRGRQQDSFRGRIMFPIFDAKGDPVAFGGRVMPGADGPKYKNSPETTLYSKSKVLYGLNWAKDDVVRAGEVVVCEGYTDVIGVALSGVPRGVATCGTALADDHFRLLKNFARRIVLAYDADSAGQAAADRFYEWEQRYEVDIAVADLPKGSDPGDLAQRKPDELRRAIEEAKPFLAFRVERALAAADLRTAEGRARAAEAALAVVVEHPNSLVRDQYVMDVADRCRIEAAELRSRLNDARSGRRPLQSHDAATPAPRPAAPRQRPGPELEALKLLIHRPEAVADRLPELLFDDDLNAAAYRAITSTTTLHEAIAGGEPEVAALLQRLAVEDAVDDADGILTRLAQEAGRRALADIDAEARHAENPLDYAALVEWLKLTIEQLSEPETALDASSVLVAWLMDRLQVEA
jgi:DNA primase